MLADENARQFSCGHTEWTAIFIRPIRFGVERIDVAWAASHPKQDDTLAAGNRASRLSRLRSSPKQIRERQASEPGKADLHHIPARNEHEPFAPARVEACECIFVRMAWNNGFLQKSAPL